VGLRFNGWTPEAELLEVTLQEYGEQYPGWNYDRLVVTDDLDAFCEQIHCRKPSDYAQLPWDRAHQFIDRFPSEPPTAGLTPALAAESPHPSG
jgi:hypothetical protein